jgi:large subunit ribosomal protein L24
MKVKICVGKDKGKSEEIIEINRVRNLAKVKAVNMVKKHKKPTKENKGGIVSKEAFVHLSNLKNLAENKKVKK